MVHVTKENARRTLMVPMADIELGPDHRNPSPDAVGYSAARRRAVRGDDCRGTLVAVGEDSPQLGTVELLGARRGNTLAPLPVPSRFNIAPPATPAGEAVNIGRLYAAFAGPIHGGSSNHPTFETAMAMHRVIDAMRQASDTGREVRLAVPPTSSGAARR